MNKNKFSSSNYFTDLDKENGVETIISFKHSCNELTSTDLTKAIKFCKGLSALESWKAIEEGNSKNQYLLKFKNDEKLYRFTLPPIYGLKRLLELSHLYEIELDFNDLLDISGVSSILEEDQDVLSKDVYNQLCKQLNLPTRSKHLNLPTQRINK